MPQSVNVNEFLTLAREFPVIDVRTPAEFEKGHIPYAVNLPLFTNEERAIVGTIYKQTGREPAIEKGLSFVIPRLKEMALNIAEKSISKTILIHCWRGGMRSGSVALLMEQLGFTVYTLKGGYKFYRRHVLASFEKKYSLLILGGRTGSSKSKLLDEIKANDRQVIFLEKLAHHKGSSYGHLGEPAPPTQEMFENLLSHALDDCSIDQPIWIEDESRLIGKKVIPTAFFEQMRGALTIFLDVPFEQRVKHLTNEYGKFSPDELVEATQRIERRLGPQQTRDAINAIRENRMEEACRIILHYYDKTYSHGLSKRNPDRVVMVTDFKSVQDLLKFEQVPD